MDLQTLAGPDVAIRSEAGALPIAGLTADSRQVRPGYLFAALPGTAMDGARFVPDAIASGAAAILCDATSVLPDNIAVPVIRDPEPRRRLALMAARLHPQQPGTNVAVTGTNGKTSVAAFTRQIWSRLGLAAASMGTVGIVTPAGPRPLPYTTPEPVLLHQCLSEIASQGVTHLALEASSHGLAQARLDGVRLKAGAFTNITRDHLDYHSDFEEYFEQKLRLFKELLPERSGVVVDADSPGAERVLRIADHYRLTPFSIGRNGEDLRLDAVEREGLAQVLSVSHRGTAYRVRMPLVGDFQSSNALVAAGLAIVTGSPADAVLAALETLEGAKGRIELAGQTSGGAAIFIDYAHTPDALAKVLDALRPYASGALSVVFGCGGDRDRGKRPHMGAVAASKADRIYVTDDNPRGEEPARIRAEILAAAPGAREIGERALAIRTAIGELGPGDVLVVAGKGHETGQIVGDEVLPFSDHDAVAAALTDAGRHA